MANCSKRLEAIISFVKKGSFVADVGSDHAYVPIELISRGIAEGAVAIDNKIGPYMSMKKRIASFGYSSKIIVSLSDGLDELPKEVNGLILAGMGGLLIRDILLRGEKKLESIDYMVIDAHSEYPALISFLAERSFCPTDDIFLFDKGKPYCIYLFEKAEKKAKYSEEELFFGPIELKRKSEEWRRYYERRLKINEGILLSSSLPKEKEKALLKENGLIKSALGLQSDSR